MKPTDFRFHHHLRVRWAEVDMQKIVFNPHYLMYFDCAIADYWRALAMPYEAAMQLLDGDIFLRKTTVEFNASALMDDRLVVALRCDRIGNSSMTFVGAIFRDGTALVTPAMEERFDAIARSIPEFWFGRFDVRFADFEALRRGEGFRIVELNGAGAESTHIWDSRTRLRDAYATLFRQYAALWRIGAENRRRGFRPESWRAFLARRRREREATARYPATA